MCPAISWPGLSPFPECTLHFFHFVFSAIFVALTVCVAISCSESGFIETRYVPVSWQLLVVSQNYVQMLYPEGVPLPPYEHHGRITHFLLTPHLLSASLKKRFHNFIATFILFSPKLAICLVPFFVWWLDLIWLCFFKRWKHTVWMKKTKQNQLGYFNLLFKYQHPNF